MILGIAVLLICVGLSGCLGDIGLTNIGDLQANPQNYLGNEVRVKGTLLIGMPAIYDDMGHYFFTNTSGLSGQYYLTGIVSYGKTTFSPTSDIYYLHVTKIEAV